MACVEYGWRLRRAVGTTALRLPSAAAALPRSPSSLDAAVLAVRTCMPTAPSPPRRSGSLDAAVLAVGAGMSKLQLESQCKQDMQNLKDAILAAAAACEGPHSMQQLLVALQVCAEQLGEQVKLVSRWGWGCVWVGGCEEGCGERSQRCRTFNWK